MVLLRQPNVAWLSLCPIRELYHPTQLVFAGCNDPGVSDHRHGG